MDKQSFIEINGKKYDAATGKLLRDDAAKEVAATIVKPQANTGVVDGFRKRPKQASTSRQPAKHATNTPQKSKTLMRSSVQKPAKSATTAKKTRPSLKKKLGVSPSRQEHAKQVSKSRHIRKYGGVASVSTIIKKQADIPVKQPVPHATTKRPATKAVAAMTGHHTQPTGADKVLEAALANASSHTEQHHTQRKTKKRGKVSHKLGISRRAASLSTGVLAAVLLAGFFAVQNVPNLAMRVAAARSGVDAQMPGYQPSGFSFNGPINYTSGRVTVSFSSNSDARAYDFTQSNSNWNSDALLANYIIAEDKQYQTYVDKGRTMFIYDGSSATWIDDGIWYRIEGDSKMTTDQLIRIASSI